jgi:hypothetical protein
MMMDGLENGQDEDYYTEGHSMDLDPTISGQLEGLLASDASDLGPEVSIDLAQMRTHISRSAWVEDYESDEEDDAEGAAAFIDEHEDLLEDMFDYDHFDYDAIHDKPEFVSQLGAGFQKSVSEAGMFCSPIFSYVAHNM